MSDQLLHYICVLWYDHQVKKWTSSMSILQPIVRSIMSQNMIQVIYFRSAGTTSVSAHMVNKLEFLIPRLLHVRPVMKHLGGSMASSNCSVLRIRLRSSECYHHDLKCWCHMHESLLNLHKIITIIPGISRIQIWHPLGDYLFVCAVKADHLLQFGCCRVANNSGKTLAVWRRIKNVRCVRLPSSQHKRRLGKTRKSLRHGTYNQCHTNLNVYLARDES